MKRAGAVWLVLVSTGLSALGGLGLLEWAVRYREAHRSTVPGTMPFLYYRHSRLGHALVRGADYYGWVHINHEGFRGREVAAAPPPHVVRIMVVGASTTMDALVGSDERAWPARLEFWLDSMAPGQRFEVNNAGVPGYRVIDNLIRWQTELHWYRPDLVVLFGAEHNDLLAALAGGSDTLPPDNEARPGEAASVTPWGQWLEQHSLLYNKLLQRWLAIRSVRRGGRRQASTTAATYDRVMTRGVEGYSRDLRALVSIIHLQGVPVAIPQVTYLGAAGSLTRDSAAITGVWRAAVPFAPPAALFSAYARFDSVTRSVAAASGAAYVPTEEFGLGGRDMYAEDDPVHFNAGGADRMGRMLATALLAARPWQPAEDRRPSSTRVRRQ